MTASALFRVSRIRWFLLVSCVAFALFGAVSAAFGAGAAVFSSTAPAAGSAVLAKPWWVSVILDDTAPVISASITVNGIPAFTQVSLPRSHWVYDDETETDYLVVDDATVSKIQSYKTSWAMISGTNTVVATVVSASGISTHTWTFDYVTGTTVTTLTPAPASVQAASPAVVSASVASPYSAFTSSMRIDGALVPTTYSAATKTFTHTPATALSPGTHTAVFTASATAGSATRTWSFTVRPPMSTGGDCANCHAAYAASHPRVGCASCHDRAYAPYGKHGGAIPTVAGCTGSGTGNGDAECHQFDHSGNMGAGLVGFACAKCHSAAYPAVPRHSDASTTVAHVSTGCDPCHADSLIDEHGKFPAAASIKYQCDLCHGSATAQPVKDAIATGNTGCGSCHGSYDHVGLHDASVIDGCAGGDCHSGSNLTSVHEAVGCAGCHSSADSVVVAAIAGHDKDCGACHGGVIDVHGAAHDGNPNYSAYVIGEVSYNAPAEGQRHGPGRVLACTTCHLSSNLVTVHLGVNSCPLCHGTGAPRATFSAWDKTCQQGACHPAKQFLNNGALPLIQHNDAAAYTAHNAETVTGRDTSGCITVCHSGGCQTSCHTVKDGSSDISAPITRVSQVTSQPVTWKLYPVDSQSGVVSTYYSFDDAPFALWGPDDAVSGIRGAIDMLRVGQHTLKCYSVDAAGNTEATRTITYTTTGVDSTPPLMLTTGIRTGSSVVATSFAISVRDPQNPAPCSGAVALRVEYKTYIRYWEYYAIPTPSWQPVNYSVPLASWDTTVTFAGLENKAWAGFGGGTISHKNGYLFVVSYYATDNSGNRTAVATDTVMIDNTGPTTTPAVVTANVRWRLSSYDYLAGVASTSYRFDGALFSACTPDELANGVINATPGAATPGSHSLDYYSVDALGNKEATKTLTYTLP